MTRSKRYVYDALKSELTMVEPHDQRIQLVASASFIAAIDEWRRQQPDLPNRSEAIRRLVACQLDCQLQPPEVSRRLPEQSIRSPRQRR